MTNEANIKTSLSQAIGRIYRLANGNNWVNDPCIVDGGIKLEQTYTLEAELNQAKLYIKLLRRELTRNLLIALNEGKEVCR